MSVSQPESGHVPESGETGEPDNPAEFDGFHWADETPQAGAPAVVATPWFATPWMRTVALRTRRRASQLTLPGVVVFVAALWATLYGCRIVFPHHRAFGSTGFDYGLFDQGMYLMSRFKAPFVTIMGRNLYADHGSFTLLPLVPLYWIWNSGLILYAAQTASLAMSAVPIYGAAAKILNGRRWMAAAIALGYLVNPVLSWSGAENFHPDTLAVFGLATAWWAMVTGRWRWFLFASVWVAATKEDMLLVVVPLGLYCAWRHHRRIGLLVAGGSAFFTAVVLLLLRIMNGVGSLNAWRIPFGGPGKAIHETIKYPGNVFEYFKTEGRPWYLWQLAFPLAFFAALRWKRSVPVLVGSGLVITWNMVSTFYYQHNVKYHYSGIIVPGLAIGAAYGLSALKTRHLAASLSALLLVLSVWAGYLWGPWPASRFETAWARPTEETNATMALLKEVPPNAVVAAHYGVISYLAHRKYAYQFPVPWKDSYWHLPQDETGSADLLRRAATVQYVVLPNLLDGEMADVWAGISNQFTLLDSSSSGWSVYRRNGI